MGLSRSTVHGRPVAVVLSPADYDRLAATGESLVAFVRRSPLAGVEEFDVERDRSLEREPALWASSSSTPASCPKLRRREPDAQRGANDQRPPSLKPSEPRRCTAAERRRQ
jgi:hypothetical protein